MVLEHTRHQIPVGQGFFHLGTISIGGPTFYYVYDCGSDDEQPLRNAVDAVVDRLDGTDLDVLFLSHLDFDHVSGLDRFLVRCHTKCAVLPYLSPVARLILIARSVDQGTLDASYLRLLSNPTDWFGERGVDRVIYVTDGGSSTGDVPNWTDLGPNGGPIAPPELDRLEKKEGIELKLDLQGLITAEDRVSPRRSRQSQTDTYVISCLQPLRLQTTPLGSIPNWQFVTFVHPEGAREAAFRQAVQRTFGKPLVADRTFEINQRALIKILQNPVERDKLASCYVAIRKDRNLTSLSVYSGPISLAGLQMYRFPHSPHGDLRAAWLGTGDSNLLTDKRRRAFSCHYHSVRDMIANLAIPHHGSRKNFHPDLCEFGDIFSVSSGSYNKYDHPHADVVAAIGAYRVRNTTEQPNSAFHERFVIGPAV